MSYNEDNSMAETDNPKGNELATDGFSARFLPNTDTNRRRLEVGSPYLTIFHGASLVCRSIYIGVDQWMNPETGAVCTNKVAFFMTARVHDIPGFPGWPI